VKLKSQSFALIGGLLIAVMMALVPALAQAPTATAKVGATSKTGVAWTGKTPWGEPDLDGIWYAFENVPWSDRLSTPAESS
jgi:hypothetical protein